MHGYLESSTLSEGQMATAKKSSGKGKDIGLYNEGWLHSSLKNHYGASSARFEVEVDGFIVDIAQKGKLIEIQTGGFYQLNKKLSRLLESYSIKVVYPLAVEKTIVVLDRDQKKVLYRRRSPKRQSEINLVDQLIYILPHIQNPHFSLEVLLTREEEVRSDDGYGSWRRGGKSILGRRLLEIIGVRTFGVPEDYLSLLPKDIPSQFTNLRLSQCMGIPRRTATKLTYCLRHLGLLTVSHKNGNALVYTAARGVF